MFLLSYIESNIVNLVATEHFDRLRVILNMSSSSDLTHCSDNISGSTIMNPLLIYFNIEQRSVSPLQW